MKKIKKIVVILTLVLLYQTFGNFYNGNYFSEIMNGTNISATPKSSFSVEELSEYIKDSEIEVIRMINTAEGRSVFTSNLEKYENFADGRFPLTYSNDISNTRFYSLDELKNFGYDGVYSIKGNSELVSEFINGLQDYMDIKLNAMTPNVEVSIFFSNFVLFLSFFIVICVMLIDVLQRRYEFTILLKNGFSKLDVVKWCLKRDINNFRFIIVTTFVLVAVVSFINKSALLLLFLITIFFIAYIIILSSILFTVLINVKKGIFNAISYTKRITYLNSLKYVLFIIILIFMVPFSLNLSNTFTSVESYFAYRDYDNLYSLPQYNVQVTDFDKFQEYEDKLSHFESDFIQKMDPYLISTSSYNSGSYVGNDPNFEKYGIDDHIYINKKYALDFITEDIKFQEGKITIIALKQFESDLEFESAITDYLEENEGYLEEDVDFIYVDTLELETLYSNPNYQVITPKYVTVVEKFNRSKAPEFFSKKSYLFKSDSVNPYDEVKSIIEKNGLQANIPSVNSVYANVISDVLIVLNLFVKFLVLLIVILVIYIYLLYIVIYMEIDINKRRYSILYSSGFSIKQIFQKRDKVEFLITTFLSIVFLVISTIISLKSSNFVVLTVFVITLLINYLVVILATRKIRRKLILKNIIDTIKGA